MRSPLAFHLANPGCAEMFTLRGTGFHRCHTQTARRTGRPAPSLCTTGFLQEPDGRLNRLFIDLLRNGLGSARRLRPGIPTTLREIQANSAKRSFHMTQTSASAPGQIRNNICQTPPACQEQRRYCSGTRTRFAPVIKQKARGCTHFSRLMRAVGGARGSNRCGTLNPLTGGL